MSWFCRFGSDASRYVVKLGDYHTKEQDDFERVLSPERIEVHRKYRAESWEHDVALIRLKGAEGKCVSFNPHTNAVCLPAPGSKWGKTPASCVITGWGMTGNVGFFLHGTILAWHEIHLKKKYIYIYIYTYIHLYKIPFKCLESLRFFYVFLKKSLMFTKAAFIWYSKKYSKKYFEIVLQFKRTVFYLNTFFNWIYFCDGKAEFSAAITSVFSVTWSFRNSSDMLIWSSRNISYYCPF